MWHHDYMCSRYAFNSLFEMLNVFELDLDSQIPASFNSLFEMHVEHNVSLDPIPTCSFNSLFEMRKWGYFEPVFFRVVFQFSIWDADIKCSGSAGATIELSILYLRCRVAGYRRQSAGHVLSILYLRCIATSRKNHMLCVVHVFQFSIWDALNTPFSLSLSTPFSPFNSLFEMQYARGNAPNPFLKLSILYLRCRKSQYAQRRSPPHSFNSLFEMQLFPACWRLYSNGGLSILYLRCETSRFASGFLYPPFNSLFEMHRWFDIRGGHRHKSFQFSIWDAAWFRVCSQLRPINFQFSIWDAGCLADFKKNAESTFTFNSLFEMHIHSIAVNPFDACIPFNSLFEMRWGWREKRLSSLSWGGWAFNSLFEMLPQPPAGF